MSPALLAPLALLAALNPAAAPSTPVACLGLLPGPAASGVAVVALQPDSPAARAGIEREDVVIRFNATPIDAARDLVREVRAARPGEGFEAIIWRGDHYLTLSGALGVRGDSHECGPDASAPPP